jgi:hypothetical protein
MTEEERREQSRERRSLAQRGKPRAKRNDYEAMRGRRIGRIEIVEFAGYGPRLATICRKGTSERDPYYWVRCTVCGTTRASIWTSVKRGTIWCPCAHKKAMEARSARENAAKALYAASMKLPASLVLSVCETSVWRQLATVGVPTAVRELAISMGLQVHPVNHACLRLVRSGLAARIKEGQKYRYFLSVASLQILKELSHGESTETEGHRECRSEAD